MSVLLSRNDVYSVVAEVDGQIAGSNFLWESEVVAGIGPVTLDPDVQNSTAGRRLMEDVLHRGEERGFASIRLVQAAYHSRSLSLYTKLGFDARELLSVMSGAALNVRIPNYVIRPATETDLDACNELCLEFTGIVARRIYSMA